MDLSALADVNSVSTLHQIAQQVQHHHEVSEFGHQYQ